MSLPRDNVPSTWQCPRCPFHMTKSLPRDNVHNVPSTDNVPSTWQCPFHITMSLPRDNVHNVPSTWQCPFHVTMSTMSLPHDKVPSTWQCPQCPFHVTMSLPLTMSLPHDNVHNVPSTWHCPFRWQCPFLITMSLPLHGELLCASELPGTMLLSLPLHSNSLCVSELAARQETIPKCILGSGVAYLSNVAVLPSARRRGVARKLVEAAEALASSWGCTSIGLHCRFFIFPCSFYSYSIQAYNSALCIRWSAATEHVLTRLSVDVSVS